MAMENSNGLGGSGQPKASILLIVGEPFSDNHKTLILEEVVKGFQGWDREGSGVDINDELAQIANRATLGEEGPNGERIVRHRSDEIAMEMVVNPQWQTVKDSLKAVLTQLSPVKAVLFAGYTFQGTPAWMLQDDLFTLANFCQAFKDPNVENALKQTPGASLLLHTVCPHAWQSGLKGSEAERQLRVEVNPAKRLDHAHGVLQFSAYLQSFLTHAPLPSTLQASDVIGNISFSRPVLYIFPAQQGDCALFGMEGFNMLVNGGYSRRSCFWDFVRHLDAIDALLLTHLMPQNLFGIKAMLQRKEADAIHPDIHYLYMNAGKTPAAKAVANGDAAGHSGLVLHLAEEGNMLSELSTKLGHAPHPLTRPLSGNVEPITLYYKVGKGSLDMYVLNPVADCKELKEFLAQWSKQAASFGQSNGIPLPHCVSVCALLVVRPASPAEKVTRILFPGAAPQHKLIEGLERVKHLDFLKHPTFCAQDLHKPKKAAPGGASSARAGSVPRKLPPSSARSATTRAEPPKRLETKPLSPRKAPTAAASSAKTSKLQKESSNKRASSAKDREKVKLDEKEKEDKAKSSASSSPSKASVKTASPPAKSPVSPVKTPATASPDDAPNLPPFSAAPVLPPSPEAPSQPPAVEALTEPPQAFSSPVNHLPQAVNSQLDNMNSEFNSQLDNVTPEFNSQDLMNPAFNSQDLMNSAGFNDQPFPAGANCVAGDPEPLPEPDHFGSDVDAGFQQAANLERQKLREMGIYDDDDDEGVDDGFDDKENLAEGSLGTEEEDIQPQPLPEPIAALDTPTAEPDLIQDTFHKQSAMEQSAIFEDGIQPDYAGDAGVSSPGDMPKNQLGMAGGQELEALGRAAEEQQAADYQPLAERTPSPQEVGFPGGMNDREPSPTMDDLKEPSPTSDEELSPTMDDLKEPSPAMHEETNPIMDDFNEPTPAMNELKEPSPTMEHMQEPSPTFDDEEGACDSKEQSPEPDQQSFSDKESSPDSQPEVGYNELKEPSFEEEQHGGESNAIEQNIQYGVTNDNGFQMGGIREEEEEEEMPGERDGGQKEVRDDLGPVDDDRMNKQSLEDLGIYDGDDADEKDSYVYEKDVNLDDEEVRTNAPPPRQDYDDDAEQDHQGSSIPEAFEKDESPPAQNQTSEGISGQGDTDSIDGGTPDDDKDIDEILAMQGKSDGNVDHANTQEGLKSCNPFVGLDGQQESAPPNDAFRDNSYERDELDHAPSAAGPEFDPMSQWGPPTGLPAPNMPDDKEEQDQVQGDQYQDQPPSQMEHAVNDLDSPQFHPAEGAKADLLMQESPGAYRPLVDEDSMDEAASDRSSQADPREFDPLSAWGQPMGLPSPPPPETNSKASPTKSADAKKADAKKPATSPTKAKPGAEKRPASGRKSPSKTANGVAEPSKSARSRVEAKKPGLDTSRSARPTSARTLDTSRAEAKPRPGSTAGARKPASAKARASPEVVKMPPLPPFTPFYLDLAYIPCQGESGHVDADFFKRVRARYYVLSSRHPNPKVLEQLLEAKATWDKGGEAQVTVIPTYETSILQHWLAVHKEKLEQLKVAVDPAASRCTVRLQDHEDSCYTYRLEF